mmetsp:Transcript_1206/g.3444  ORF Transcript_1206/g.3444 Transcript_1206/m.3444 type:complete len:228 (-) Transcript_1206:94-777(-)
MTHQALGIAFGIAVIDGRAIGIGTGLIGDSLPLLELLRLAVGVVIVDGRAINIDTGLLVGICLFIPLAALFTGTGSTSTATPIKGQLAGWIQDDTYFLKKASFFFRHGRSIIPHKFCILLPLISKPPVEGLVFLFRHDCLLAGLSFLFQDLRKFVVPGFPLPPTDIKDESEVYENFDSSVFQLPMLQAGSTNEPGKRLVPKSSRDVAVAVLRLECLEVLNVHGPPPL